MPHWITYPLTLTGKVVDLISLNESHFPILTELAKEKSIWQYYAYDGSDPVKFRSTLESALVERKQGFAFPFVIFHKEHNKIIGSTRFMDIQLKHKKLEIGTTWLHPEYWGTAVNLECKLMLLTFCFETLQTIRVQFKTDENNMRSRKAIEKVGGQFEGILRHDMLRSNQTKRNSAYFSIIDDEWPEKKILLTQLFQAKINPGLAK